MIDRETNTFISQFKQDPPYQDKDLCFSAKPYIKILFNPDNCMSDYLAADNCVCPRCKEPLNLKIGGNTTCQSCGLNVSLTYSILPELPSFAPKGFVYRTSESSEREMERRERDQLSSKIKILIKNEYQSAIVSLLTKANEYKEWLAVN